MSTEERREAIEHTISAEEAAAATEPAPEPEGEQPAEEPQEPAQQPDRGDPRIALRQEREENRDLKSEVAELRGQLQALFQQRQEPQQPEEPEDPEPEVPSIEALRYGDVALEDYLAAQQARQAWQDRQREKHDRRVQEFVERELQREQVAGFARQVIEAEGRFRQTTPDYDQAFEHLFAERAADLSATGLLDEQTARRVVAKEMEAIARTAVHTGRDPAAYLYNLARRRGYGSRGGLAGMVPQHGVERGASSNPLQALLDAPEEDLFSGKVDGRALLRGASR